MLVTVNKFIGDTILQFFCLKNLTWLLQAFNFYHKLREICKQLIENMYLHNPAFSQKSTDVYPILILNK